MKYLFIDCVKFCNTRSGSRVFHGDYYKYGYPSTYDLLFLIHKILRPGGFLRHTFFGDCLPQELVGFTYHDSGSYGGPDMILVDGISYKYAQIGYYYYYFAV